MTAVTTLPFSRALTYDDLAGMPQDGHRYELVDGVLVVSPSPVTRHQRAVGRTFRLLDGGCPADREVLLGPFDVVLARDTVLVPDVIVARRSDLTAKNLPTAPVLAVEVLSPSTRRFDLLLKRSRLEAAGCANYWVIDPDVPSVLAWALRDGAYVEVAHVIGAETFVATTPFAVSVVPEKLVSER